MKYSKSIILWSVKLQWQVKYCKMIPLKTIQMHYINIYYHHQLVKKTNNTITYVCIIYSVVSITQRDECSTTVGINGRTERNRAASINSNTEAGTANIVVANSSCTPPVVGKEHALKN